MKDSKVKTSTETATHWEDVYKTNPVISLPWEEQAPSGYLIELIESGQVEAGPVLDICTGSGNNAIYLASKGYTCQAVDISPTAIDIAKEKATKVGVTCDFRVGDVLDLAFHDDTFNLVFDRGCFHNFVPSQRPAFVNEIHRVLKPGGLYHSIASVKEATAGEGRHMVFPRATFGNFFIRP